MLATYVPAQTMKVDAASETYDIEYSASDATTRVNGKCLDGDNNSYDVTNVFNVKKIIPTKDANEVVTGTEIVTDDTCKISKNDHNYLAIPKSDLAPDASKTVSPSTSYLFNYYNETDRDLNGYEIVVPVTNVNYNSPLVRGSGLLLPIYQDPVSKVVLAINVGNYKHQAVQANYVYVGGYKQCTANDDIQNGIAKNFGINVADGASSTSIFDQISKIKLQIEYKYSNDNISNVYFTIIAYDLEGKQYDTTYTYTINASKIIEKLNVGINVCGGTVLSTDSNLSKNNVIAGYISGSSDANSVISDIKVCLSKTEEEYQDEIKQEIIGQLPDLYQAFVNNKCYETADAYLEVYNQLTDALKTQDAYKQQIQEVNSFLREKLVSNGVLNFDKANLSHYSAVLEYVWPTADAEATSKTSPNGEVYSNSDVTSVTAVFNTASVSGRLTTTTRDIKLHVLDDLATDEELVANGNAVDNYGPYFHANATVTFYGDEANSTTTTELFPVIRPTKPDLGTENDTSLVLYRTNKNYGKDMWDQDEVTKRTASNPLSYQEYQKWIKNQSTLKYLAVQYEYLATEVNNSHTKIKFVVRQWVDDGDGVYESDTDVWLFEKDRFADMDYMAIAYKDSKPRQRNFTMTGAAFDAMHKLVLASPSSFLAEQEEMITVADGFNLDDYIAMSADEQNSLKSKIQTFMEDYTSLPELIQTDGDVVVAYTKVMEMFEEIVAQDGLADKMQALYDAFIANSNIDTAGAYFEAYVALSELNQDVYEAQMSDVYEWIYDGFETGLVFKINKTDLEAYPNMLEYIWPSDGTFVNSSIYDSTDVVSTTAVFNKDDITNDTKVFMFSDLASEEEEPNLPSGFPDDFGITFVKKNVSYYTDAEGSATATTSLPLINANITDVKTLENGAGNEIVYKIKDSYGKDEWGNKFANILSLDTKEKIDKLNYMAVKLDYVATEVTGENVATPHTKIEYTVQLWADDGDGVYDGGIKDVLLIEGNRSGESVQNVYLAIAYLNGQPRVRKAALTTDAFAALHSIQMERRMEYSTGDLDCNEVIDDADADLLRKYLVGLDTTVTESAANVNGRDGVDVCDLVALKVLIKEQEVLP